MQTGRVYQEFTIQCSQGFITICQWLCACLCRGLNFREGHEYNKYLSGIQRKQRRKSKYQDGPDTNSKFTIYGIPQYVFLHSGEKILIVKDIVYKQQNESSDGIHLHFIFFLLGIHQTYSLKD